MTAQILNFVLFICDLRWMVYSDRLPGALLTEQNFLSVVLVQSVLAEAISCHQNDCCYQISGACCCVDVACYEYESESDDCDDAAHKTFVHFSSFLCVEYTLVNILSGLLIS